MGSDLRLEFSIEVIAHHDRKVRKKEKKILYDFYLNIWDDKEIMLMLDNISGIPIYTCGTQKIFFLTGSLLKSFYKSLSQNNFDDSVIPPPEEILSSLLSFYGITTNQCEILDEPMPLDMVTNINSLFSQEEFEKDTQKTINFLMEVYTILDAVRFWLHPKEGQQVVSFLMKAPSTKKQYTGFFQLRCGEFTTWPVLSDGKLSRVYNSSSILPLCWAEIWYAIDHKIKAGLCPYCWDVFIYPSNNYQKAHCGRNKCKRAHIIKQHGGEEGYRKWESSRKKPADGEKRKRGRPKKKEG